MKEPTFDTDGYPTEETLETIKNWKHTDGYDSLMRFVEKAWKYDGFSKIETKDKVVWVLSTFGWSGNESIIGSLKKNTLFWIMCWYFSKRGGLYVFHVSV